MTLEVEAASVGDRSRAPRASWRLVVAVIFVGLVVSAGASWGVWSADRRNEDRLLGVQTRQAAALISAEVVNITSPLVTALHVAIVTTGDGEQFATYMSTQIGSGRLFDGASLWRLEGSSPSLVTSVGVDPTSASSSSAISELVRQASHSNSFVVAGLPAESMTQVVYALADASTPGLVVLGQRGIPPNRRVPIESHSAFSNLHYVTYLGDTTRSADLATTDVDPSELPLRSGTYRTTIPFGNTVITLVTSRARRLGGSLGAQLPWIFLAAGSLMTVVTAAGSAVLVRRRRVAEHDAATITRLYEQLDHRFGEQRHISETLQRALLPQRNPSIPGLEVASRYVAGTRGVDVGGDWYSIIRLDDNHFGFVVGDVSGRGLSAATIMARLRFTLRAYLLEGHPPERALQMCGRQIDVIDDGHFATVLVGVGNLTTRAMTLANAGHLNPLLLTSTTATYITTEVGVPLGVGTRADYQLTTFTMPPNSTLIAFTDGLVERRGEDLLKGMDRLAATAAALGTSLDDSLSRILSTMHHDGPEDDIAILAFQWATTPTHPSDDPGDATSSTPISVIAQPDLR
jgi:serine phosphatase RsbU (regulator of sigma subunit)